MPLKNPKIALITILTDNMSRMLKFYQNTLGFKVQSKLEEYVEFESDEVRFALCSRKIMEKATGNREYKEKPAGHSFELAFPLETPQDVDDKYKELVDGGAKPIKPPADMPWGQRTAFFADPDGNIHELFSNM